MVVPGFAMGCFSWPEWGSIRQESMRIQSMTHMVYGMEDTGRLCAHGGMAVKDSKPPNWIKNEEWFGRTGYEV